MFVVHWVAAGFTKDNWASTRPLLLLLSAELGQHGAQEMMAFFDHYHRSFVDAYAE